MASNGQLPASSLAPIGGGLYLRRDAAQAFLALSAEARRRYGRALAVRDAYRPLGAPGDYARGRWSQWAAWERYEHGGNLAAHPGTSNHGWGVAIDLETEHDRQVLDALGARFGWSKSWSDAPSEWWHIRYQPGHYHPAADADPLTKTERRWVDELLHLRGKKWNPWSRRRATSLKKAIVARIAAIRRQGNLQTHQRQRRIDALARALKPATRR